jgi:glycosyltransferase involved in cell wall biosynthesis
VQLKNKTILLISPQAWGTMMLAKHHYAIELARAGNEVYFLSPPRTAGSEKKTVVRPSGVVPSLYIIEHTLPFSYKIKFKWEELFHFLMRFHLKKIMKAAEVKPDIIWSFDLGHYYPFRFFENTYNIYHPVDEPGSPASIRAAAGAKVIMSVTREILDKFRAYNVPKVFIHHGLSQEFAQVQPRINAPGLAPNVGMSGNWLRPDLDFECLKTIIRGNANVQFHLWGSYEAKQSNIGGGENKEALELIAFLQTAPNVKMYGPVNSQQLAAGFMQMDAFLVCYDIEKDQSKGTNYHKLMEYISSGKVIIANNITTYANLPGLIEMCSSRTNNDELPALFKTVMDNLQHYNDAARVTARRNFALSNLYSRKVAEVEAHLPA